MITLDTIYACTCTSTNQVYDYDRGIGNKGWWVEEFDYVEYENSNAASQGGLQK